MTCPRLIVPDPRLCVLGVVSSHRDFQILISGRDRWVRSRVVKALSGVSVCQVEPLSDTNMPDVEHGRRQVHLRMLPRPSKFLYPSLYTRSESLWPFHRVPFLLVMAKAFVRERLASRFLQEVFHWSPYQGQRSMDLIFIAVVSWKEEVIACWKKQTWMSFQLLVKGLARVELQLLHCRENDLSSPGSTPHSQR